MNDHFTKTIDFMFDTFEHMIQEFKQHPSIASFQKLESYFSIMWYAYAYRIEDGGFDNCEYRYINLKRKFDEIESMMEEVERQQCIQAMLQTLGFNNRFNS